MVAGGVILNPERTKVLMITATNNLSKWILPKGGIERDEATNYSNAALRECWEEAGVEARIVRPLGKFEDMRPLKELRLVEEIIAKDPGLMLNDEGPKTVRIEGNGNDNRNGNGNDKKPVYKKIIPRSEFHFYEMVVGKLFSEWPEQDKRQRKWCDFATARQELEKSKRPELVRALELSSIAKG